MFILALLCIPALHATEKVQIGSLCYSISSSNGVNSATVTFLENSANDAWTTVSKPMGVVFIPDYVWHNGQSYQVKSIAMNAFKGCDGITAVVVAGSGTTVMTSSFTGCTNLHDIYLAAETSYSNWNDITGVSDVTVHTGASILVDGNPYTEQITEDTYYVRAFNSGNWVPLFVPFNTTVGDWGTNFQIAQLTSVTYDETANADVLHWQTLSGETTPVSAHTPYIIRNTGSEQIIRNTGSEQYTFAKEIPASDFTTIPALLNTYHTNGIANITDENYRLYGLIGTYSELDGIALAEVHAYCMGGGNFHPATISNSLHAQRFYMTITDGQGNPKSAPEGGARVMVDGEVVGIIEHIFEPQLLIDDNYYDVLGRRIDNPQAGQLYIHQGKKIIYSDQPTTDY